MSEMTVFTAASMTSLEISALVEKRHDNVKRTIETLAKQDVIVLPHFEEVPFVDDSGRNRTTTAYIFTGEKGRRDSIVVVAQLSPEFTGRLVDRWQELEAKQSAPLPRSFADALQLAADQQRAIEERDELLALAAPKIDYYDQVAKTCERIDFAQAFSLLHGRTGQTFNRQTFLDFLRRHGVAKKENAYANIGRKRFVPTDAYRDSWFLFNVDGPGPGEWVIKMVAIDGIIRLIEQDRRDHGK